MDCLGMVLKSPVDEEKMQRKITIQITAYDNLIPTYPVADAFLRVEFDGKMLLQTDKVPIISNYNIPVDYTFDIDFDWINFAERDKLLSNPITMVLTETPGSMDPNLYNIINEPKPNGMAIWQSIESVLELQEALLGKQEEEEEVEKDVVEKGKKSPKRSSRGKRSTSSKSSVDKKKDKRKPSGASSIKSSKSNKSKNSAKGSSADKSRKKVTTSQVLDTPQSKKTITPTGPIILGIGTIDLLNVFLGNNEPEQSVLLKQYPAFFDDRMTIISKSPVIRVKISVEDDCISRSVCSLTVESIFNIPDVCTSDLRYKLHIPFPSASAV